MCEFESRLIAWIDGELEPDEALETEQHLSVCPGCSARAREYKEVSRAFSDYCGALIAPKNSRRLPSVALGTIAAAAAIVAMVIWVRSPRVEPLPFTPFAIAKAPAMALRIESRNRTTPVKLTRRRPAAKPRYIPQPITNIEPSIEIAIPAEAVFAPGAVPPGFNFAAELSIANDGSPRALLLRP
jgi:anti-sigma factor RsiW